MSEITTWNNFMLHKNNRMKNYVNSKSNKFIFYKRQIFLSVKMTYVTISDFFFSYYNLHLKRFFFLWKSNRNSKILLIFHSISFFAFFLTGWIHFEERIFETWCFWNSKILHQFDWIWGSKGISWIMDWDNWGFTLINVWFNSVEKGFRFLDMLKNAEINVSIIFYWDFSLRGPLSLDF